MEWKKLGEVCEFERGRTITAKDAVDGDIPVIAGGQTPSYYHNEANREGESITVAGSGAYAGFVSYWNQPIFVSDAFTVEPKELLSHKYLYHWLKKNQEKIHATQKGAGVPHVHGKDIANFLIPIPSLQEQERIVGILDMFTASIDNIKAQIEQRRKQYEHYRNTLLTFNKDDDNVEWKTLGEVAYYPQEKISASKLNKTNYVSVENLLQNKAGKVYSSCCPQEGNWKKYEIGDILIGNIRPNLRKIWLANIIGGTNGDVLTIRINDTYKHNISTNFLYYILSSEDFFLYDIQNAKGAKMPRGDKKVILDYPIPLPSLQEQQRIVSILDTFEASINNLEAQLEQRQKQYEYYREKLLTFE